MDATETSKKEQVENNNPPLSDRLEEEENKLVIDLNETVGEEVMPAATSFSVVEPIDEIETPISQQEQPSRQVESRFSWPAYLQETGAEAATADCFFQSIEIPQNRFAVVRKLESPDPRGQSGKIPG
jgi:hypothetical protein